MDITNLKEKTLLQHQNDYNDAVYKVLHILDKDVVLQKVSGESFIKAENGDTIIFPKVYLKMKFWKKYTEKKVTKTKKVLA